MANLGKSINPKKIAPAGEFEPLAAGNYPVAIVKSEVKQNQESEGSHLALTMKVIEGPAAGRLLWQNVTLKNPSAKAVEIGEQELSAICHAVGHMGTLKDSEALHGQPFLVRVVVDPETGRNKIGRVLFKEKFEDTRLPARPVASSEEATQEAQQS